jgi:hypothetical protein
MPEKTDEVTYSWAEASALRRLERAAREVVRYPNDRKPHSQLANALRHLDRTRKED